MSEQPSSNYRVEHCEESGGWTVRDGDFHVATFAREQDAGDYLAHFEVIKAQHEDIERLEKRVNSLTLELENTNASLVKAIRAGHEPPAVQLHRWEARAGFPGEIYFEETPTGDWVRYEDVAAQTKGAST